jgi:hypothetical protein
MCCFFYNFLQCHFKKETLMMIAKGNYLTGIIMLEIIPKHKIFKQACIESTPNYYYRDYRRDCVYNNRLGILCFFNPF